MDDKSNVRVAGAGWDELPVPLSAVTAGSGGGGAGLKISPQNTNSATAAAQTKTTRTMAATGKFLAGSGALDNKLAFAMADGIGRSPVFVPDMINFGSSDSGACGAVIFWKHVGHSITVPLCDESHFMCWPQTGHANLNSLMVGGIAFHIHAASATWIFYGIARHFGVTFYADQRSLAGVQA
jgi:hypothetical protein